MSSLYKKGLTLYPKESESAVFTHYLGTGFNKYSPKLIAVNDEVVLNFSVDNPSEINNLLEGFPVTSIKHAADRVPSAYEEPVR